MLWEHGGNIVGEALSRIASWLGAATQFSGDLRGHQHPLPSELGGYKAHSIWGCHPMIRLNSISLSEYAEFLHRLWPGAGLPARLGKSQLSLGAYFTSLYG